MFGFFKEDWDKKLHEAMSSCGLNFVLVKDMIAITEAVNNESDLNGMEMVDYKTEILTKYLDELKEKSEEAFVKVVNASKEIILTIDPVYRKHPTKKGDNCKTAQTILMTCYIVLSYDSP